MNAHKAARPLHSTPVLRTGIAKRRSNRMNLNAPVALSGHDRQKCSFAVSASATNLNQHGAAIQLNHDLPVGCTVVVRNKRGIEITARVVTQISAVQGKRTYGIEFVEQDDRAKQFWGISFPSA